MVRSADLACGIGGRVHPPYKWVTEAVWRRFERMVFTTQCPRCGKVLWFASNRAGKMTICPACGAVMTLTAPEGVQPGADAWLNVKPLDEGLAGGQVNLPGIIPPGATSSAGIPQG